MSIEEEIENIVSEMLEEQSNKFDLDEYDFPDTWTKDIENIVENYLKKVGLLEQDKETERK